MSYAPTGAPNAVCAKGAFPFAAIGLDHGHIYGVSMPGDTVMLRASTLLILRWRAPGYASLACKA